MTIAEMTPSLAERKLPMVEVTGLTMSSLEIAGLAARRHDNVLRDIRKMADELGLSLTFEEKSSGGRPLTVVNLPKRETMILVSGYSTELRARIIDRWMDLENAVAAATSTSGFVTDLGRDARTVIGGILKGIVHKELSEVLPAMVTARIAEQSYFLRRGRTAGQIWREHGFPRIRITSWFSNRLSEMGCRIEGNGCGELGLTKARLFDPDRADTWLKNGGRALVENKIAERQGQGRLRLVGGVS